MVQKHDCLSSQLSYLTILQSTLNWVDLFLHRSRCIWTLKDTWRKSQLTPSTQLEDRGVKDLHILVSSNSGAVLVKRKYPKQIKQITFKITLKT